MGNAYDDRDGFIWMDGELIDWKSANVHILTHAMHYGSSVFEGERAYNGKIFKSVEHSRRLIQSGEYLDIPNPYNVEEIEQAKKLVLKKSGLQDAYIRALKSNLSISNRKCTSFLSCKICSNIRKNIFFV